MEGRRVKAPEGSESRFPSHCGGRTVAAGLQVGAVLHEEAHLNITRLKKMGLRRRLAHRKKKLLDEETLPIRTHSCPPGVQRSRGAHQRIVALHDGHVQQRLAVIPGSAIATVCARLLVVCQLQCEASLRRIF